MPKLDGHPPGTIPLLTILEKLGMSEGNFRISGLGNFFHFYQIGRMKLYLAEEVNKVEYWLSIRRGMVELGYLPHNSPLLPPGEDTQGRWEYLERWLDNDCHAVECPKCWGQAVQDEKRGGPIWCPKCGEMSASGRVSAKKGG